MLPFILFPNFSASAESTPGCFLKNVVQPKKSQSLREKKCTWAGRYLWQQRLLHGLCRFSHCHTMKSQTSCATYRFQIYFNSDVFKSPRSFWISMKSPWIAHQGRGEFKFPQNQPYFCFVLCKLHHNLRKGFYRVVCGICFLLFLGWLNIWMHWTCRVQTQSLY